IGDADVDAEGVDAALGKLFAPRGGGLVADLLAAAADRDVGAEAEELLGHRLAEAGAAAGDEDALAGHQLRVEHGRSLRVAVSGWRRGWALRRPLPSHCRCRALAPVFQWLSLRCRRRAC